MTEAHPEDQRLDLTEETPETPETDAAVEAAGELVEPADVHAVEHPQVEHPQVEQPEGHEHVEHAERAATQLSVLPTPVPGPTGVPRVDAALDRLAELSDLDSDPEQHVAVLEDVHDRLQSALSGPDESAP